MIMKGYFFALNFILLYKLKDDGDGYRICIAAAKR